MRANEFTDAIDALVSVVKEGHPLDRPGFERLLKLDSRVFEFMLDHGLELPLPERNPIHFHRGNTLIPNLPFGVATQVFATDKWIDSMAALRARAERIGKVGSDGVEKAVGAEQAGQARSGDAKPNGRPIVYANEKRDKWIYDQACKPTTPWQTILNRLAKIKSWRGIETIQGLRAAVNRYVQKHGVTPIPERKSGRPNAGK